MNEFGVLTSRKRALVALFHSIVFLGVAIDGFAAPKGGILHGRAGADLVLAAIYLTVASILGWLVSLSRGLRERAYFSMCACSASFGLLRTIFGDANLPAAQYMRVLLLSSAVAVGGLIVWSYSRATGQSALPE
ncbi:MAG TPA: hypothetical protein VFA67_17505 [Candidatus Sulfotelmatobacter sp.]|nr:hypothetical protein [Candidatus Sulfotelmatobacter sp.]